MTPRQERTIEALKKAIAERNARIGHTSLKTLEITEDPSSPLVFLLIEYGRPNDEGTAAEIFCRDRRHIAITPRGGLRLLNAKRQREARGFFNAVHELIK